jgi:hypothetical protein
VREVWPVGLNRECLQTATPHHTRAPITLVGLSHDGIASSILRRWPMLGLIPSMLKAALGVAVAADDPIEGVMAFLSDQRMLVVCDSCEHVVGAADVLVEKVRRVQMSWRPAASPCGRGQRCLPPAAAGNSADVDRPHCRRALTFQQSSYCSIARCRAGRR